MTRRPMLAAMLPWAVAGLPAQEPDDLASLSEGTTKQTRHVTPGGLRIFTIPDDSGDHFRIVALIGAGTQNEPKDQAGLAALLGRCLLMSTRKHNFRTLRRELRVHGARYLTDTTHDDTTIGIRVHPRHWRFAVEWLGEVVSQPAFDAADVDTCRSELLDEFKGAPIHRDDSDGGRLRLLYPNHPLGREIHGDPADLERMLPHDVRRFYHQHFVAHNIVVAFSGRVAVTECQKAIAESFATLRDAGRVVKDAPPRPAVGKNLHRPASGLVPMLPLDIGYHLRAKTPEELLHQLVLREYLRRRFGPLARKENVAATDPSVTLQQHVKVQRLAFSGMAIDHDQLDDMARIVDKLVVEAATPLPQEYELARDAAERTVCVTSAADLRRAVHLCWLYEHHGGRAEQLPEIFEKLSASATGAYAKQALIAKHRYHLAVPTHTDFLMPALLGLLALFLLIDWYRGFPTVKGLTMFLRVQHARREQAYEEKTQKAREPQTTTPVSGDELVRSIQEFYEEEDRQA